MDRYPCLEIAQFLTDLLQLLLLRSGSKDEHDWGNQYVSTLQGRLELHLLPPYAPDSNPDEFVWSHMKTNGAAKKPLKKNESLRKRVEKDFRAIKKDRELARSFFCADSVVYAKD